LGIAIQESKFLKGLSLFISFRDWFENRQAVENFFFSVGNQKKLFYNFNTATHGATFN
jgi:hypothetical protein